MYAIRSYYVIQLEKVEGEAEQEELKGLIQKHLQKTESSVAEYILSDWEQAVGKFVKVIPTDYKRMLTYIRNNFV